MSQKLIHIQIEEHDQRDGRNNVNPLAYLRRLTTLHIRVDIVKKWTRLISADEDDDEDDEEQYASEFAEVREDLGKDVVRVARTIWGHLHADRSAKLEDLKVSYLLQYSGTEKPQHIIQATTVS